jgi:hypothetical protein
MGALMAASIERRLMRLEEAEHRRELERRAAVLAEAYGVDWATSWRIVTRTEEACKRCAGYTDAREAALCIARELDHDEAAADELLSLTEQLAEEMTAGLTFEQLVRRRAEEWRREMGATRGCG